MHGHSRHILARDHTGINLSSDTTSRANSNTAVATPRRPFPWRAALKLRRRRGPLTSAESLIVLALAVGMSEADLRLALREQTGGAA